MRLASILIALCMDANPLAAESCGVALLFALDVSVSVHDDEAALQRHGLAEAFRDPVVQRAIARHPGGVVAGVMQWAGPGEQDWSLPWRSVASGAQAKDFARSVDALRRPFGGANGTAIGNALHLAESLFLSGDADCHRRVIDVSGDGRTNVGHDTAGAADRIAAGGGVINGLVIELHARSSVPKPLSTSGVVFFYETQVMRGPGSFVLTANGYADFRRAIRLKLLRELSPRVARRSGP